MVYNKTKHAKLGDLWQAPSNFEDMELNILYSLFHFFLQLVISIHLIVIYQNPISV